MLLKLSERVLIMMKIHEHILAFILVLILLIGCAKQAEQPVLENEQANQAQNAANSETIPTAAEPIAKEENNSRPEEVKASEDPAEKICNMLPLSSGLSPGDKYYCLAVVKKDPSICNEIKSDIENADNSVADNSAGMDDEKDEETPKLLCLAISSRDVSYCRKLPTPDSKKVCYNVLAQTSRNINVCSDIDFDMHTKQQCYFNYVNALYWEDESNKITAEDCDKVGIDDSKQDKNTCLAFKARDVSLCGSNKNCLTFFKQEMSFCSGATFKDENECIRDRAMTNKDMSICRTFSEQTRRDDCHGDFSSHINPSTAVCDKIVNGERRQSCYTEVAIKIAK